MISFHVLLAWAFPAIALARPAASNSTRDGLQRRFDSAFLSDVCRKLGGECDPCLETTIQVLRSSKPQPAVDAEFAYKCLETVQVDESQVAETVSVAEALAEFIPYAAGLRDTVFANAFKFEPYDIKKALETLGSLVYGDMQLTRELNFERDLAKIFWKLGDAGTQMCGNLLTGVFSWHRPESWWLQSISIDGGRPQVFVGTDLEHHDPKAEGWTPSPVEQINGIKTEDFLKSEMAWLPIRTNDAKWNAMFASGRVETDLGAFIKPLLYPGADTTLTFQNATKATQLNYATALSRLEWATIAKDYLYSLRQVNPTRTYAWSLGDLVYREFVGLKGYFPVDLSVGDSADDAGSEDGSADDDSAQAHDGSADAPPPMNSDVAGLYMPARHPESEDMDFEKRDDRGHGTKMSDRSKIAQAVPRRQRSRSHNRKSLISRATPPLQPVFEYPASDKVSVAGYLMKLTGTRDEAVTVLQLSSFNDETFVTPLVASDLISGVIRLGVKRIILDLRGMSAVSGSLEHRVAQTFFALFSADASPPVDGLRFPINQVSTVMGRLYEANMHPTEVTAFPNLWDFEPPSGDDFATWKSFASPHRVRNVDFSPVNRPKAEEFSRPENLSPHYKDVDIAILTDGGCAFACARFLLWMKQRFAGIHFVTVGGLPDDGPMSPTGGSFGGPVSDLYDMGREIEEVQELGLVAGHLIPSRLWPTVKMKTASVTMFDVMPSLLYDSVPMQFTPLNSECRLHYTWERVAQPEVMYLDVYKNVWGSKGDGEGILSGCVPGSTPK